MTWIIGIDEAGYGPNLGPFVMTAVACQVSGPRDKVDLWDLLRSAVRRAGEQDDGRLLVADSKVVYVGPRGLAGLERGTLTALSALEACLPGSLAELVSRAAPSDVEDLVAEAWYRGTQPLPTAATPDVLAEDTHRFRQACFQANVGQWQASSVVICPPRFNALAGKTGSKGAVLAEALRRLLQRMRENLPGDDALAFVVDKHGGRNRYAAFVQDALPGGAVVARREEMAQSAYEVVGLGREVRLSFQPRAESACLCVALASMASKYLRELFMAELNAFWADHVPGLKPTAGYPGDAARFLEAIRPAAAKLGIAEAALWRYR